MSPTNRDIDVRPPHSGRIIRDDNSFLNVADWFDHATGMFGKLSVVERTPMIELKSSYGLSNLRDITSTAGSATITNTAGEYNLSTTANGPDSATLDSAARGQYIPGSGAEAGVGVRIESPGQFTGDQEALWGYGDDDNGLFYGVDADGLFLRLRTGGVDTDIRQADWNSDKLDGSGPSGLTLDVSDGHVFQVMFAWYGYGVLEWTVFIEDATTRQRRIVMHREKTDGSISIGSPNLPIRAQIANNGTDSAADVFIGGRQFSLVGKSRSNERINGEFTQLTSIDTTFLPVVSFRKKAAFTDVPVKLRDFATLPDADMRVQFRLNPSLTGASFGNLTDTSAGETALEVDTDATAISGGEILWKGIVEGGGGSKTELSSVDLLSQVVPEAQPISMAARRISGTGGTLNAVVRLLEEW